MVLVRWTDDDVTKTRLMPKKKMMHGEQVTVDAVWISFNERDTYPRKKKGAVKRRVIHRLCTSYPTVFPRQGPAVWFRCNGSRITSSG